MRLCRTRRLKTNQIFIYLWLFLGMTFTLGEKKRDAKANNNKFPVNILIRCTTHSSKGCEDAKKVICLHSAPHQHSNCSKTKGSGGGRQRSISSYIHTYSHEIKCLMVFIFHFWGCGLRLRVELSGWGVCVSWGSCFIPFLIKILPFSMIKIPST